MIIKWFYTQHSNFSTIQLLCSPLIISDSTGEICIVTDINVNYLIHEEVNVLLVWDTDLPPYFSPLNTHYVVKSVLVMSSVFVFICPLFLSSMKVNFVILQEKFHP